MKKHIKRNRIFGSVVGIAVFACLFLFQELSDNTLTATVPPIPEGNIIVEFLDVGQADAALIRSGQKTMLIDAGNNEDGPLLADYLEEQGITNIDVLIGTHPHEDHIGGMDNILRAFSVDRFILPDVISTTETFTSVLDAAEEQNLKIITAEEGMRWNLEGAVCEILCCEAVHEEELNEWSVVIRLVFGNTSFLFTGDGEAVNERRLLESGKNLSVDILKSPHHGSATSSTKTFLQEISPKTVIISVGEDNDYGHPDADVLRRYEEIGAKVYRTDLQGTILVESDGKTYTVQKKVTDLDG